MFETGAIITGLSTLVLSTMSETAKAEGGSTLAKWLNKDISSALKQQVYNASKAYLKNYQERHGKLKVACVRMDAPMELDKLYTAVQVLERSELTYFESIEGLVAQYRRSGRRGFRGGEEKQNGIDTANQEQFLMVLGGPGIGKSTLLRKVGLEALKGKVGAYTYDCIPVFLPLQRFKDVGVSIEQRITQEFETCGFPEPEAVTSAMLRKGKLLVLLDGLDEVAKDIENAVIEQIRDFVDAHSNNRFITSCRVAAYKGGFPRFKDVALVPFEDEQIEEFIQNWFSAEKDQENDTAGRCWDLLQRPEYAATRELAQTPLLLTLLCAVYNKQQAFPKNRASLYGEALDVVLKEWAAEKRIHNEPIYLDLPLELELELLAELAFDSFVDDQLFFDKRDVTRRIKEFLVGNLNAPKYLDSEAVLEALEVQQGILTERARDAYSFSHLTFQEHLTAQHIVDTQQVEWLVEEHITDQQWREIFLLVAGLLRGKGADFLLHLMETKCNVYLKPRLVKALVEWAEAVTSGSENQSKPAAKRALAIFWAVDRFQDSRPDTRRVLNAIRSYTLDIAKAINHDCAPSEVDLDFEIEVSRPIPSLDQGSEINFELTLAKIIQCRGVLNQFPYIGLCQKLSQLKERERAENLSEEQVRRTLLEYWSKSIRFDLKQIGKMGMDGLIALDQYLYSCLLLIQCKDAAVRVSPQVWHGIEERLLTVSKDAQP